MLCINMMTKHIRSSTCCCTKANMVGDTVPHLKTVTVASGYCCPMYKYDDEAYLHLALFLCERQHRGRHDSTFENRNCYQRVFLRCSHFFLHQIQADSRKTCYFCTRKPTVILLKDACDELTSVTLSHLMTDSCLSHYDVDCAVGS